LGATACAIWNILTLHITNIQQSSLRTMAFTYLSHKNMCPDALGLLVNELVNKPWLGGWPKEKAGR